MSILCSHSTLLCASPAKKQSRTLSRHGFTFSFHRSVSGLGAVDWADATHPEDRFLQLDYLEVLEQNLPEGMQVGYLMFYSQGNPVGVAYCQLVEFRADEHVSFLRAGWRGRLKNWVARQLHFRLLICGNMLLTGNHAYHFRDAIPEADALELLAEALHQTFLQLRRQGEAVDGILIKDFVQPDPERLAPLRERAYHSLRFQPTMVLPVAAHWTSFADYLADLSSKYRVRYRRGRKRAAGLQLREMDADMIRRYSDRLYNLYRQVAERSDFCMTYLHPNYFLSCKERFPDAFRLWGYFAEDRLVGFYTTFRNAGDLEAHFLGMETEAHLEYDLYLNMLYDLIEWSIKAGAQQLILSRTAMEIKSAVGALPLATQVVLTHPTNPILNWLIAPLVAYLEPASGWTQRHPFSVQRLTAISLDP